ncbi:efflux RND transporter periplasmic adaptor subunit [Sphingomonas immobilis]|uniref:Efflux RND transporter periplasmic adaptor subunit n=1 Tax=Sphingomonas immobilis TaxID=3063997 RepID=A0ABT9A2X3_9SPHN|nr:efflux RND transporter periplasmic adaptor subunit [Sphingomonas sp. CA1-15]MDO7843679.1 efflux RND transporter periplasmic adaptor subunit [Sphingomonas sp. CA1-15]
MNMETHIEPATTDDAPKRGFSKLSAWQRGAVVLVPLALIGVGVTKLTAPAPAAFVMPPASVTVATPLVREVSEWDDYTGRFAPSRTVEIRPRVAGEVVGIHFKDGEVVQKGQLLFTIDPRPFAAALAEARANAASAGSALTLAKSDFARASRLVGDEAVSAGEVDSLRAKMQSAQAALAAAQAVVRTRSLDMDFTQVRAPIAGRISDRRVDAGNQVAGGAGTGGTVLTVINALDPIYFTFDGSEALYLKTQRARQPGAAPAAVEIQLQDETEHRWKGRLDFTDNGLDQRSGTIRARAVLNNPNYFLTPGMFGNMRLASAGTTRALLVPDSAVQTDQARKIVLVVDKAGLAAAKPVELGPVVDGLRVIRSGLAPTDKVVIAGINAAPGAKVDPHPGKIAPVQAAPAPGVALPVAGEATLSR